MFDTRSQRSYNRRALADISNVIPTHSENGQGPVGDEGENERYGKDGGGQASVVEQGQEMENDNGEEGNTVNDLPRKEALYVMDGDIYHQVVQIKGPILFRESDSVVLKLQFLDRHVAIPCPCELGDCAAMIGVGKHAEYALNASPVCVHCGDGPFHCKARLDTHLLTAKCRDRRSK